MKFARIIAVTVATGGISLGLLGLTAPSAHADMSWGYSAPVKPPVKPLK